jgi:hypothetical protein
VSVHRQPFAVAPLQYDCSPAGAEKGVAVLVEAGGSPGGDPPGNMVIASGMDAVQVYFEVLNVGPDAFPLVFLKMV